MKYLAEYRDHRITLDLINQIKKTISKDIVIMEICGGQTHAMLRHGLDQLLPSKIEFIHGPGCPVCVTSLELIDKALEIAQQSDVIFTTYGDMLRVPGSGKDLNIIRADGGDIRVIYSPLDAIKIAQDNPDKQVVFFAIGFETTAPANAMTVIQAKNLGLKNYSMLVSQVRVPPAMEAILSSSDNRVQTFLAAGHVCTVMGYWEYIPLAKRHLVPIVITGFEPVDILNGVLKAIQLFEIGKNDVVNAYSRLVTLEGNIPAQKVINRVYKNCHRNWRGIGLIDDSGWCLNDEFIEFDAEKRFQVEHITSQESPLCIAGLILQGIKKPYECSAFGKECSPETPLGATMVSSEGACSAYYKYSYNKAN